MTELEGDRLFKEAVSLYNNRPIDVTRVKTLMLSAFSHGSQDAIVCLSKWRKIFDIKERLEYMEIFAKINPWSCALTILVDARSKLSTESTYRLGRIVKHIDESYFNSYADDLELAQSYEYRYMCMLNRAKSATLTWLIVAKRLKLYRDVARLIARIVWDGRMTTDYHDRPPKKLKK
jgi:hypothetical protein